MMGGWRLMSGGTAIEFSPLLPWLVLIPLFVLAAAGVLVALIRRARGTAWRTLGLAALAVALAQPVAGPGRPPADQGCCRAGGR